MADELNIPTHRWYEPRNNISLSPNDFSKQWIYDSGIQKIDAFINGGSPAFSPSALFALAEPGVWYDPSDVANLAWRRNLLTYTEQFDNAAWTKTGTNVTANAAVAPDGATTADALVPATTGFQVLQSYNVAGTYTASVSVKNNGAGSCAVAMGTGTIGYLINLNLSTGAFISGRSYGGATLVGYTITSQGSGWWRVTVSATGAAGGAAVFSADGTSPTQGVLIWGAQLELGSVATDYQKITDVNTEVIERFPSATLYQDTAGTTPVTTPGQTVALALDKSKGLVLGSELVTNGDFSSGTTGWSSSTTLPSTATVTGGEFVVSAASASGRQISAITCVVGRTYKVTGFARVSTGTGTALVSVSDNTSGLSERAGTTTSSTSPTALTLVFVATQTTHYVTLGNASSGTGDKTFDNISVKELPGNHATQATLASRPTYGIVPLGGRRNLLTRTEEFDNAEWVKGTSSIPSTNNTAPDGTATADQFVTVGTVNTVKPIYQTFSAAATTYTFSAYVKDNGGAARAIDLFFATTTLSATVGTSYNFDTDTLTNLSSAAPFTFVSSSKTSVGSGWFRVSVAVTVASAQTIRLYITAPYAAAQVGNYLIWGAQLEINSTATAYQRVGSAFDVTEAGVASLSYLSFDGVDDFMVTPTITPGIDRAQVFAGVRKLTDPTFAVIAETSAGFNSNAGSLLLFTNTGLNGFVSRGSLSSVTGATISATAPVTSVLTGLGDIATDVSNVRQNGIAGTAGTGDQGTGNYLAYPMYIGRRGGTLNPINMNLFSLIVRFGTNLDAGTITSTETWVAGKTGVTL